MDFTIEINGIKDDSCFNVKFNKQKKVLNNVDNCYTFNCKEAGIYSIVIEQIKTKPLRLYEKVLYLILSFIEVIFFILLFHDNKNWCSKIKPFCLICEIRINIVSSSKIVFDYVQNEYFPDLFLNNTKCNSDKLVKYDTNEFDFEVEFFHYFRNISAMFVYAYLLFIILIMSSYRTNNFSMGVFCSIITLILLILHITVFIHEKRKINKLKKMYSIPLGM